MNCIDCNGKLSRKKVYRCLICSRQRQFNNPENNPNWKGGLPKCLDCNVEITKGRKRCRRCCFKGKNNPNYIHGEARYKYSMIFRKIRSKIRTRDKFICQGCGIKEENHYIKNKKTNLTVHHIDYDKDNCRSNNLITTCSACNSKANFDRDYWFAYYKYIIGVK